MTNWQDWIERYVREVARQLPREARADVAGELRSLLTDEIEERIAGEPGRPAEEIALDRISAFGDPSVVARRYAPDREYLIGPALYPAFRTGVMIVLGVYAVLALLWAIEVVYTTISVIPFRFEFTQETGLYEVLMGALANLGVLVVVFAAIERLGRRPRGLSDAAGERAWDPRKLAELPRPGRVSRIGHTISIVAGIFFLATLHFAPEWLGILIIRGDEWGPFPVLDPNYRTFLPLLDVWLVGGILHDVWLIFRGFKDPLAHGIEAVIDGFGAFVALRIVADGPFTVLDVAFKPVIAIVAVIILVSSIAEAVRAVRMAHARHLIDPGVSGV
ncbi:MAG: HAAS signaling domain-containing protein [Gemmatimonadota bacterium]